MIRFPQKTGRLRQALLALALPALLAGCAATPGGQTVRLTTPFDQDQALMQLRDGGNTIEGTGLLLHPLGGAASCAGQQVLLIPVTAYADERMAALYGIARQGLAWAPGPRVEPDLLAYQTAARAGTCDAQGAFRFERVADGGYYLVTAVPWEYRPGRQRLASLARRFSVEGGAVFQVDIKERP